jgi:hypothetical protein
MRTIAYWAAGLLAVRLLDGPLAAQNPAPGAGGMDLAGTEYFDRVDQPSGDRYLVVTSTIEDPANLTQSLSRTSRSSRTERDGRLLRAVHDDLR